MFSAARGGSVAAMQWLREEGVDPNAEDDQGGTPMSSATANGHLAAMKWLKERGADVNAKNKYGSTLMSYAAHSGNVEAMKWLKEQGVDPNAKEEFGEMPIHSAAERGNLDAMKWLHGQGADLNAYSDDGTPLLRAVRSGNIEALRWLKANGANVRVKQYQGYGPMHMTSRVDVMAWLKENGADVNERGPEGWTPMHMAAGRPGTAVGGNSVVEIMRWLQASGADVNARDNYGRTPMHRAAVQGTVDALKWLSENGADVNAKDDSGWTPLRAVVGAMNAAGTGDIWRENREKTLEWLKANGANGDTPPAVPADAPVAVAKAPAEAFTETWILLDASESYDRGDAPLAYHWRQTDGPRVQDWRTPTEGAKEAQQMFRPTQPGRYVFELVVSSGDARSRPVEVVIEVKQANRPPTVELEAPSEIRLGEQLVLKSRVHDPDGDEVIFGWKQREGPEPFLFTGDLRQETLTLTPVQAGKYVFEFQASDRNHPVVKRFVTVTVVERLEANGATEPPAEVATARSGVFPALALEGAAPPEEEDFRRAKPVLENLVRAEPDNAAAYLWLGECHYNLMEFPEALAAFKRATELRPSAADEYYILRGEGFAHLHYGIQLWKRMEEERADGRTEQAEETFSDAHQHYLSALYRLQACLRRTPDDSEAVYGRAMAMEGASRKLYSNAVSHLRLGPEGRERANLFAENCIEVIDEGLELARRRANDPKFQGETGPWALMGGLYLRKAMLYQQLGKIDLALAELENAAGAQSAIIAVDKNDVNTRRALLDIEEFRRQWAGEDDAGANIE